MGKIYINGKEVTPNKMFDPSEKNVNSEPFSPNTFPSGTMEPTTDDTDNLE